VLQRIFSVYAIKRVVEVAVLPEAAGAKLEIVVAVRLPRPERPLRQLGRSTLPYPRRGAASPVHDKVANQQGRAIARVVELAALPEAA